MFLLNWLVKNFRMGLATNSSSSHSLVFFKTPRYEVGEGVDAEGWEEAETPFMRTPGMDVEFGWGMFVLDTLYEKLMYALVNRLQSAGYSNWYASDGKKDVEPAFREFGHLFPELTLEDFIEASQGYIDHQSIESGNADRVLEAARNPFIEIWGGNDNGGDPHEDYEKEYDSARGEYVYDFPEHTGIQKVEYL